MVHAVLCIVPQNSRFFLVCLRYIALPREHISEDWVQAIDQSGATTMECANTENELRFTFLEQRGKQKIKAKHRPVSVRKCVVLANFFRLYI